MAIGALLLFMAVVQIPIRWIAGEALSLFDWVFTLVFFVNGLSLLLIGLGSSIERFFGKAYVKIDSEAIKIKLKVLDKEQRLDWAEIDSVDYKAGVFIVTRKDRSTSQLTVANLEYATIQEIKEAMQKMAASKKVVINLN